MTAVLIYLAIGAITFPLLRVFDLYLHKKREQSPDRKLMKLVESELRENGYINDQMGNDSRMSISLREFILGTVIWPIAIIVMIPKIFRK